MNFEPFPDNIPRPTEHQGPKSLLEQYPQFKPGTPAHGPGVVKPMVGTPELPKTHTSPYVTMQPAPDMPPSQPVAEATALSVALPSKFAFYEFKDLFVSAPKAYHLAKFAKAHAEQSFRITAEAISSLLTTTNPNYQGKSLAHYLTIPDFYFVLYFIRINNYNKTQFTHRTRCNNLQHIQDVRAGKLPEESLIIEELVTGSSLENRELTEIPVPDENVLAGVKLTPVTVQSTIEWLEHPQMNDPEMMFLGQLAVNLAGNNFESKLELAKTLTPDQVQAIRDYDTAMMEYGIKERITVRCKGCGASMETTVLIDAHSFLPN